ncbi:hypothetical protein D9M69_687670 [compost metagenome]
MQIGPDLVENHLIELAGLEPGRLRRCPQPTVLVGQFKCPTKTVADGSVLPIDEQAATAHDQEEERQHRH